MSQLKFTVTAYKQCSGESPALIVPYKSFDDAYDEALSLLGTYERIEIEVRDYDSISIIDITSRKYSPLHDKGLMRYS